MKYLTTAILIMIGGMVSIYPVWSQTNEEDMSTLNSVPQGIIIPDNTESALTVQFENMNPHVGQLL